MGWVFNGLAGICVLVVGFLFFSGWLEKRQTREVLAIRARLKNRAANRQAMSPDTDRFARMTQPRPLRLFRWNIVVLAVIGGLILVWAKRNPVVARSVPAQQFKFIAADIPDGCDPIWNYEINFGLNAGQFAPDENRFWPSLLNGSDRPEPASEWADFSRVFQEIESHLDDWPALDSRASFQNGIQSRISPPPIRHPGAR